MDLHCLDLCQLNITDDSIAVLAKGTEVIAVEVTSPTMLAWYVMCPGGRKGVVERVVISAPHCKLGARNECVSS